jgi:hypothetical protein
MTKKTIWFISKDVAPIEYYYAHIRTIKQAQYFQKKGYNVKIFCSNHPHNTKNNLIGNNILYKEDIYDNIPFVFIRSLSYKKNGIKRLLSYLIFSLVLLLVKSRFSKPAVIVHNPKIPFDCLIYKIATIYKTQYIVDVTDLYPYTIEEYGNYKSDNILLKISYKIEHFIYSKADQVIFSMEGGRDYIIEKKWDLNNGGRINLNKVFYVNNGIDLKSFYENINKYSIEDDDLNNNNLLKIIYLGTIRSVNNLSLLIETAKLCKDNRIVFLIYGDGPERDILLNFCNKNNVSNVIFKNKWIEPQYVPYVLNKAAVNVLNYSKGWGKYGGSMNKMFMAMASGKPICCNAGMAYSTINKFNLGIDKTFESPKEYLDAILSLLPENNSKYTEICQRSQDVAKMFDFEVLNEKFSSYCNL